MTGRTIQDIQKSIQQKEEIREEEAQLEEEGLKGSLNRRDYRQIQVDRDNMMTRLEKARNSRRIGGGKSKVGHEGNLEQPERPGSTGETERDADETGGGAVGSTEGTVQRTDENAAGDEPRHPERTKIVLGSASDSGEEPGGSEP